MEELDWSVGEVMRVVSEEGVQGDTITIFTSDNGPFLERGAEVSEGVEGGGGVCVEGGGGEWRGVCVWRGLEGEVMRNVVLGCF